MKPGGTRSWRAGALALAAAIATTPVTASFHAEPRNPKSHQSSGQSLARLERFEYSQVHMGMPVRIVLYAPAEPAARAAAIRAFARIASLDAEMSDYRPDSAISEVSRRAPAPVRVSADFIEVMGRAIEIARLTGGAFDPTIAPVVALWREARKTGRLPDAAALDRARALVGWRQIALDREQRTIRLTRSGMTLDLGGIAKGYIIQAALEALQLDGVRRAMVEAGGDVVAGDPPPGSPGWRIELPAAAHLPSAFVASASALSNRALSTSGPAMQGVEIGGVRYSHVIDPGTGRPLTDAVSAHVIDDDAARADALATTATVLGTLGLADLRARFPRARIELVAPR
ncbi:MAG TPA: FAD:protein FMN transferase [Vicinamibacterales bacterium]|nr:FAD:protein FMN transferase [Vicinamibacterales bacterium]